MPAHKNTPSFYICFGCNRVAQIGVGVVEGFDEDTFEFQETEDAEKMPQEYVIPPVISVNIKDIDDLGRVFLNNSCTLGDLHDQGIKLVEGLKLVVDEQGWRTDGIVEYSEKHDSFVAVIDWSKFVSPIEDVNSAKRWKYLSCRIETSHIRRYEHPKG